jgi:hypothetical protein
MNAHLIPRNTPLETLLEAGSKALSSGDRHAAHDYWRMAAVTNPYEERVWVALMDVITEDDDREVCLENIIAINPLNPDARRQLRALRTAHEQAAAPKPVSVPAPIPEPEVALDSTSPFKLPADAPAANAARRPLGVSILTGVGFGVLAIVLGIVFSIILYGGLLASLKP